jgi:hypothetical protein
LENLFEEARIIQTSTFHREDYEKKYLRDSNGYIKREPKLPMKIESWFSLADNSCKLLEDYTKKAFQKNESINDLIKQIALRISHQWISTHKAGIKQVEDGLRTQGKLLSENYDVI